LAAVDVTKPRLLVLIAPVQYVEEYLAERLGLLRELPHPDRLPVRRLWERT
jgi:hypothetical protein